MSKIMNVGVIGTGFMGRAHSNAYRKLSNFFSTEIQPVLKTVCALEPEETMKAFADQWGYESYETDWRAVVDNKDIDHIDICTPNNTHKDIVLAAAAAFNQSQSAWKQTLESDLELLRQSRPTAVNLFWAISRMQALIDQLPSDQNPKQTLLAEARRIHAEDVAANRTMGEMGAELIVEPTAVITHCNAGALATGG